MEMRLPELGEGILEAELVAWLVQPGDQVQVGQILVEVLTDKAAIDLPSPFAGTIVELRAEPGQIIPVGDVVLVAETATTGNAPPADDRNIQAAGSNGSDQACGPDVMVDGKRSSDASTMADRVSAAPSVRRRARELGVELANVDGSGPGGRILMGDLSAAASLGGDAKGAANAKTSAPQSAAALQPGTRIAMRGVRRKIAEHMVRSKNTIPHYTYIDECDVTELVRLRESLKPSFAERGVKLTYLAFVLKATAEALKDVPLVNASLDEQTEEIVLHDRYHLGIAVATGKGLIVPVVRDVDRLSLSQVAAEIQRLGENARAGKTRLEDLRDGTFTVTSIGSVGGLISTPIINHPEVGILGTGKIVRRPVYDEQGEIGPAEIMYLSFSYDHRVIDGAIGAEFGNAVIKRLVNPAPLLIDTN